MIDEQLIEEERFCEQNEAWSEQGISEVVGKILYEKNTLFESLMGKVVQSAELQNVLRKILFKGDKVSYNPDDTAIHDAEMYGFIVNDDGKVRIANRIFETRLYNYFLTTEEMKQTGIYRMAVREKNQFIENGRLNFDP